MRIFIALPLLFVFIALTDAGVIKNFFTNVFGGSNSAANENNQKQPSGYAENEQRTPGQSLNSNDDNYRSPGLINNQENTNGQYGAGGTYSKRPLVVGGTTEKYKNTSWYIENEDYLSPNRNETKQQLKPNEQYGAAGTYNQRPSGATQRPPGYGNFGSEVGSQQQRPNEFFNNNNNNNNNYNNRENYNNNNYNQRPSQESSNSGYDRNRETTRSSVPNQNATESKSDGNSVVLKANEITCTYANLKEDVEKRKLRCNEEECQIDQVHEKSSLWACGPIKCTIANVDFSQDHGSKTLIECHLARHIIDVPLRCGPDEKEVRGKCRKIFN